MEISYINKSKLVKNDFKDFISTNLEDDEQELKGLKRRKQLTLIGLSTFYVVLILVSFTILN